MKRIIPLIIIGVLVLLIRNLVISTLDLSKSTDTVGSLKLELEAKKVENEFLRQKLSYVKSEGFIEKEARKKLGLVKEGEFIVIAPPPETPTPTPKKEGKLNWKRWWELFF